MEDLTLEEGSILKAAETEGELSGVDLYNGGARTRTVSLLIDKGYLKNIIDDEESPSIYVITEKGKKVLQEHERG